VLVPITESEYDAYMEYAVSHYADTVARVLNIEAEESLRKARAHIGHLLPDGVRSKGHHFTHVMREGEPLGSLWYQEQPDESPPRVYIYDIVVRPEMRGRGVGSEAIAALEETARRCGAEELMLSVFFHNEGAIRLYRRLGFEECERGRGGMRMRKAISREA